MSMVWLNYGPTKAPRIGVAMPAVTDATPCANCGTFVADGRSVCTDCGAHHEDVEPPRRALRDMREPEQ